MANDCDAVLIGICCCHGWPYIGVPVVGAVREMASVKQRKLWNTGEGGLYCHPNSTGSLVIARRTD